MRREEITSDIEKDIVTALIVDKGVCHEALRMIKSQHFKTKYFRIVLKWIEDYFKKYQEAPGKDIEQIFKTEKKRLESSDADLIELLLIDISERYEEGQVSFNTHYSVDKARQFCKMRNLEILVDQVDLHLVKGEVAKADALIRGFDKVSLETSKWTDPFDKEEIIKTFTTDSQDDLFELPGVLGELLGTPLQRGWLIAYEGPMKRGKSWYLLNLAFEALTHGLKVVFVSLEMSEKEVKKRIYSMLTAATKYEGEIIFPLFDCRNNQDGTCEREERKNQILLMEPGDETPPPFDKKLHRDYLPCTFCRRGYLPDYIPAVWYDVLRTKKLDAGIVLKKAAAFKLMFKQNLRVIAYPPFSVNIDKINEDTDDLEYTEKFVSDLRCIDYLDITAPVKEAAMGEERSQTNIKWQKLKGSARAKYRCEATVSQTTRPSFNKTDLDEGDTSEDIRKLAHPDLMMGLNQTDEEKSAGIMRINVMAFRHEEFSVKGQVIALQSLRIGQPFLDSEYAPKTWKKIFGTTKKGRSQERKTGRRKNRL